MVQKILIANRGEIACRISRTAQKMQIATVAIYSDADKEALHVKSADEAYRIGPAPSRDSYLNIPAIIAMAKQTHCDAIHPGYGFLSENSAFAKACLDANLVFIGPPIAALETMGCKRASKIAMQKTNIPLLPGYHGQDQSLEVLKQKAGDIGYPVLLKATAGGGGKGMRVVRDAQSFAANLASAQREALSSFGNDTMLIEKYLEKPRHIEMQVFADSFGNVIHLFERDCSIQRRAQKIIEEAPAPHFPENLRKTMANAAVTATKAIDYVGAGTIEFLVAEDNFYFMEMNTRLQVEHPVTEFITGLDLVEWQIRVASGEPLPRQQKDIDCHGHAIEVRIYAENPDQNFLPATGKIHYLRWPETSNHCRIDSGITRHDMVTNFYDPMLAKLIVHGKDRETAIHHLHRALNNTRLLGLATNIEYLKSIINLSAFIQARLSTNFIPAHATELSEKSLPIADSLALCVLFLLLQQRHHHQATKHSPWSAQLNWQPNLPSKQTFELSINDSVHTVLAYPQTAGYHLAGLATQMAIDGHCIPENDCTKIMAQVNNRSLSAEIIVINNDIHLFHLGHHLRITPITADNIDNTQSAHHHHGNFAPMTGTVTVIATTVGATVAPGDPIIILEAMKMEHTIPAPCAGVITAIHFNLGDTAKEGATLFDIEPTKES